MLKRFFALFSLFTALPLFAIANPSYQLPHMIDFGKFPTIDQGYFPTVNPHIKIMGGYAFNYAPEVTPVFALLQRHHQIDTVVETGTYLGGTTALFALLFDHVHTIEIQPKNHHLVKTSFQYTPNVTCHLGSSEQVLRTLLPQLKNKRTLFYLDAHWESHWPLLEELEEISKTHKDNCVIVIDDFKVPGRTDIAYDYYGKHECSLEYIKAKLDLVFTDYTVHYLIPRSVNSHAKLIAIPKAFAK